MNQQLDELIEKSKTASFFQTKGWLTLWEKYFGASENSPEYYDGKNLIGYAPLFRNSKELLQLLGVTPVLGKELVSDYGDIIAIEGKEKQIWGNVLDYIKSNIEGVKTFECNFIRNDSPSFEVLKKLGGYIEEVDVAPYLDLPKTWDEYLLSLSRHNRHELRRKMKKAREEDVKLVDYSGNIQEIDVFFKMMEDSDKQKKSFLSITMKEYFKDIISTFYPQKMVQLSFLKKGNQFLAGVLLFLFHGEVLLYNSGFEPTYSVFPTGLVLKALTIKRAIEEGMKRYDFLRGKDRYKYDLGGKERKLIKFTFNFS